MHENNHFYLISRTFVSLAGSCLEVQLPCQATLAKLLSQRGLASYLLIQLYLDVTEECGAQENAASSRLTTHLDNKRSHKTLLKFLVSEIPEIAVMVFPNC